MFFSGALGYVNPRDLSPSKQELTEHFFKKYGDLSRTGWGPRLRLRFDHFTPDDHYECLVRKLVTPATAWLDVGAGRFLFPSNLRLAEELSQRARWLVGVDPDDTIDENRFVHRGFKSALEDFEIDKEFDVITLRMVVEHIADPERVVDRLQKLCAVGGLVVIYTVNKWSPVSIVSKLLPFKLHHVIKRILWRTEEKDTFPVVYKMNTRRVLRRLFGSRGFQERHFTRLSDCRSSNRFRALQCVELSLYRLFRAVGLSYPEHCLLAVYERTGSPTNAPEPAVVAAHPPESKSCPR